MTAHRDLKSKKIRANRASSKATETISYGVIKATSINQQGDVLTCSDSPTHKGVPTNKYTNAYTHTPCDAKLATDFLEGSDGQA